MTWYVYDVKISESQGDIHEASPRLLEALEQVCRAWAPDFHYLLIAYDGRVKLGLKLNAQPDLEKGLGKLRPQFPTMTWKKGQQDEPTAELMAIGTVLRRHLGDPGLKRPPMQLSEILHYELNPYGYDTEARTYLLVLLSIEEKIQDPLIRNTVKRLREDLLSQDLLEIKDDRWAFRERTH